MEIQTLNEQKVTCCICLEKTDKNKNFQNWNCVKPHSESICDKCFAVLQRNNSTCPLCRSKFKYNIYAELIMIDLISITQYNINDINYFLSNN